MTPLAAQLFGTQNLAGLTGTFNIFMTPGNLAAAPLAGLIFSASGGNWHAPISYSGGVQIVAIMIMFYGISSSYRLILHANTLARSEVPQAASTPGQVLKVCNVILICPNNIHGIMIIHLRENEKAGVGRNTHKYTSLRSL